MQYALAQQSYSPDLVDQQQTGIVLLDHAGTVLFANSAAETLLLGQGCQNHPLAAALEGAERLGLLHPHSSGRILAAVAGDRELQFRRRDEHTLRLTMGPGLGGTRLLEIADVSKVVETILSQSLDPLTGLANRVGLLAQLAMDYAPGQEPTGALLYIDIDRFKGVNDTLGHPVGDRLLKLVAERMANVISADDMLVRLGGDEFAILLKASAIVPAAEALARRLVDLLGRPYLVAGHMIHIGASVGIALASGDGQTPEDLIRSADLALFNAKSEGRGTFRFFNPSMADALQQRRALEIDMRRALALKEFSLVYQAQYAADRSRLVGFEALLRWNHETRGAVSPAEFIPLAEEIGLMTTLGEWVLRTACMEAAKWPKGMSVAVNISPVQFRSTALVAVVASALAASGLPPEQLELEITEGALLNNTAQVMDIFTQLKALGVRFAMDDFGTGYSSLSYLQKFPFDKIKIDQSFVRTMPDSHDSAAIVRAISALGTSLGMTTVAEGVETEDQLMRVARDGCMHVQGYLTGRPVTADLATQLALATIGEEND
ncbi:MAG: diguanylate cyclase [Devosia sp.]|nr:diguanylate cyclase [Devosia sp.]